MRPVIIFGLGLADGRTERRFFRFTEREATQKGGIVLDPVQITAPEGSRMLTDNIGRLVKLSWETADQRQTNEIDASRAFELAENKQNGFQIIG